jgi:hypothetical protein
METTQTPTFPTLPPFIPRKPIKYKPRVRPVPLETLNLVSAAYDESVPVLTLVFDRAIDASGFASSQVSVNDGSFNMGLYGGTGEAIIVSPTTIQVALVRLSDAPAAPVTLSATVLTLLRAVDDGGTWAGVAGVGLPYDG